MVKDQLTGLEKETEKNLKRQTDALEQEKQARAKADEEIREKLKTAQTSGLHIAWRGVVWLVAGVIMSTIPGELARAPGFLLSPHWRAFCG